MQTLVDTPTQARDYAALNLAWAATMSVLLAATAKDGAEAPSRAELPVLGLAAFALTKAVSREKVGIWIRDALVDEPAGECQPKGRGVRYALGELVTCARCLGTWSSLGLVGLRVVRPREGRIVASVLAVAAVNDLMQVGFATAVSKANASELVAEAAADRRR